MDETQKNCLRNLIIDGNQYSNRDHNTCPVGINHPYSITTIILYLTSESLPNPSLCKNSLPAPLEHETSSLFNFGLKLLCPRITD